jgi:ATCase_reg: aspartate carbamoyltransferase, regulatory subunit
MAKEFEKKPNRKILDGKVVATLFFEPSTRTRLSFETAANRLGARVIGFTDPKVTSSSKGETLKDTIMMVSNYADIIVMRHFLEGAARYASEVAPVPIVNAGDGANQHPSQTMLDLYSIYKTQGTLENLNIYLVGDLKYGRTVHSLLMAMRHFNPTFHFIAPEELKMPEEYKIYCKEHHIKYKEYTDFNEETIADADILYMTRVQRERFTDLMEYERVKDVYILRNKMLEHTRPNLRILHPLPRVNEIAYDVDENPKAYYFQQAQNGLYARQAILCDVLGITLNDVIEDAKSKTKMKMSDNKQALQVAALKNGTVIDHIPSDKLFTVVALLGLQDSDSNITIGNNFESKKLGKKGIIKVADRFFTDEEISRLSVVAPNVKLNIIRDYEVVEKKQVLMPEELRGIVKCANPKCITNNEPMTTLFHVIDKEHGILKCHYCEKEQSKEGIKLL